MKKVFSLMLCLMLSVTIATPILAEDGNNDGATEEAIKSNSEAILTKDDEMSKNVISPKAIVTKKFNIPRIQQETEYYCGPASIQMVLNYLGISRTQSHIAYWVGTTESGGTAAVEIADYLREVSGYNYVMRETSSRPLYNVVNTFNDGKPVIYNVRPYYFDTRYQQSTLHYVVGNGYSYDNSLSPYSVSMTDNPETLNASSTAISALYIVDPYRSGVNSTTYNKMVNAVNKAWGYYIY